MDKNTADAIRSILHNLIVLREHVVRLESAVYEKSAEDAMRTFVDDVERVRIVLGSRLDDGGLTGLLEDLGIDPPEE